jgi:hypothetical protein
MASLRLVPVNLFGFVDETLIPLGRIVMKRLEYYNGLYAKPMAIFSTVSYADFFSTLNRSLNSLIQSQKSLT